MHSLKDLPTEPVPGLILAAVPARARRGRARVRAGGLTLNALPPGAVIGTGSMRQHAQLLHARPDLVMKDIRGNVDTRLRKLQAGDYDALVLAEAGLQRLWLSAKSRSVCRPRFCCRPLARAALGLECRAADRSTRETLAELDHAATHAAVVAERSMLRPARRLPCSGGRLGPRRGRRSSCDSQASCSARTAVRGSLPSVRQCRRGRRSPRPGGGRRCSLRKEPRS